MKKFLFLSLLMSIFSIEALPRVPVSQVARSNNGFGLAFYSTWIQNQGRNNFVFSPLGISSSMAMAYLGTNEETQKQIAEFLFYPLTPNYLGESFKRINGDLSTDKALGLAISMWVQQGLNIDPDFKDRAENYFEGRVKEGDFEIRTDSTRNEINTWVAQYTSKKIPFLLNVSDIPRAARIVLVGTVTLQAQWEVPFNTKDTTNEDFFITQTNQRGVSMMSAQGEYAYFETDEVKVVEIPYAQTPDQLTRLGFWIVLPKAVEGLKAVEEGLSIEKFNEWRIRAARKIVSLKIPRFRINQVVNPKEVLEKMGLKDVFVSGADFSKMTEKPVFITKIIQKTFFMINEKGTDAKTFVPLAPARPLENLTEEDGIQEFIANRPFMFFVLDNNLGQLIFLGRFCQP